MGNYFTSKRPEEFPEKYPLEATWILIREYYTFMQHAGGLFEDAKKQFGKSTYIMRALGIPTYVVTNDVENITYILKTNFENFPKGPEMKTRFQDVLGNGIFNAEYVYLL